jgi:hypothetical protein
LKPISKVGPRPNWCYLRFFRQRKRCKLYESFVFLIWVLTFFLATSQRTRWFSCWRDAEPLYLYLNLNLN